MTEKYIRVEDAILAAQEGADVWDGGCNPERDKHIRLAISAKPTYTPAEIMAGMWVPVTPETLPENPRNVLVTVYLDGKWRSIIGWYDGERWNGYYKTVPIVGLHVVAWMDKPLPQPPKEATP